MSEIVKNGLVIAIASGKGGTGKTTVAVNMAKASGFPVQLFDCDVEEPNVHLFLKSSPAGREIVNIPVPSVNEDLCDGCGECSRFCRYRAIACFGTIPVIFPEMCHGCGGCVRVCPKNAITEVQKRIGVIETSISGNITLISGRLDVGIPTSPPLIRAVKSKLDPAVPAILDAPPGTSCPVVATLRGADLVVLVTEPTPFGLNDLKLAVDTVRELGLPFGVVINRAGSGDDRVISYCGENNIPLLLEFPDDRRVAEAYSRGEAAVDVFPEYVEMFEALMKRIEETAGRPFSEKAEPNHGG